MCKNILPTIIILTLFDILQARWISREIKGPEFRKKNSFIFLDRINFDQGEVSVNMDMYLTTPRSYGTGMYDIQVLFISDQMWEIVKQDTQYCDWRQSYVNGGDKAQKDVRSFRMQFSKQTNLLAKLATTFNTQQQTTYHIFIADCKKTLINQHFNKKSIITLKANIQNSGQIHGQDEQIYTYFIPIAIIASFSLLKYQASNNNQSILTQQQSNYPLTVLKISIIISIISLFVSLFNHLLYISITGSQSVALGFVEAIIDPFSDCFLLTLLTMLAYGWYSKHKNLHDQQIYLVIAAMISVSYVILNILTKINDNSYDKYHFHDSIPSKILIGFRILCLVLYYVGLGLMMENKKWRHMRTKRQAFANYQIMMAVVGTFAFMDLPVLVFFSEAVSSGWRQVFIFVSIRASRLAIMSILSWQFTNTKSTYRKVCTIDQSFMQQSQDKYF